MLKKMLDGANVKVVPALVDVVVGVGGNVGVPHLNVGARFVRM